VLRDLGFDPQIIFNKNTVMVLPTGVNKASGLLTVLDEMRISHHNVIAVGDAENVLANVSPV
jgi:hydroxymethylpyrimidine pyrophosphatase-like HAD family hydrolase